MLHVIGAVNVGVGIQLHWDECFWHEIKAHPEWSPRSSCLFPYFVWFCR